LGEELTEKTASGDDRCCHQRYAVGRVARRMGTNRNALYKLMHDTRLRLKRRLAEEGLTTEDVLAIFEKGKNTSCKGVCKGDLIMKTHYLHNTTGGDIHGITFRSDDQEFLAAMKLNSRQISDETVPLKFEGYIAEIFSAYGLDLDTPATLRPRDVSSKRLFDATDGYDGDPKLLKVFSTECRGDPDCRLSQVIEGPINFFSLCEHHAFPFFGHAYVGLYRPRRYSRHLQANPAGGCLPSRFAVQERMATNR